MGVPFAAAGFSRLSAGKVSLAGQGSAGRDAHMGLVAGFHAFLFDRPEQIENRVAARTYRCTECDNEVRVDGPQSLPPCLICRTTNAWQPLEAAQDFVAVRRIPGR